MHEIHVPSSANINVGMRLYIDTAINTNAGSSVHIVSSDGFEIVRGAVGWGGMLRGHVKRMDVALEKCRNGGGITGTHAGQLEREGGNREIGS